MAQGWHDIQWLLLNGLSAGHPMRFDNNRIGFDAMWARRPAGSRVVIGLQSTGA
ncbi:hypothetical protein [Sulfobacillus thermosulfidooxidans]|uniref:hypothetical protein n=1 Tax=Sulfobacillus thermosulfidooxidans TaxID=28034 RepID=UPI000B1AF187|nr:hypothetical protein [Sulfobacillus thermosulfidooxidans]